MVEKREFVIGLPSVMLAAEVFFVSVGIGVIEHHVPCVGVPAGHIAGAAAIFCRDDQACIRIDELSKGGPLRVIESIVHVFIEAACLECGGDVWSWNMVFDDERDDFAAVGTQKVSECPERVVKGTLAEHAASVAKVRS